MSDIRGAFFILIFVLPLIFISHRVNSRERLKDRLKRAEEALSKSEKLQKQYHDANAASHNDRVVVLLILTIILLSILLICKS